MKLSANFGGSASATLLILVAALLAGCSGEVASINDVYVPQSVDERFPIRVVERPVKLGIPASSGRLEPGDANAVIAFARKAEASGAASITVSYPQGSKRAAKVAADTAAILKTQGVRRSMIHMARYNGSNDVVTLIFTANVAVTKECGDWPSNLNGSFSNEPPPNLGCATQNNIAAMVTNPEDFVTPRAMPPLRAMSRTEVLKPYYSGNVTLTGVSNSSVGSSQSTGSAQ